MTTEKTTLEVIASTVEEATAKGLAQLGLPASAVDIEVLDSGSRGLFGLGGRQARIRLVLKDITEPAPAASRPEPVVVAATPVETTPKPNHAAEPTETMDPASAESARQVVSELLEKMKVQAQVTAHWPPPVRNPQRSSVHHQPDRQQRGWSLGAAADRHPGLPLPPRAPASPACPPHGRTGYSMWPPPGARAHARQRAAHHSPGTARSSPGDNRKRRRRAHPQGCDSA